MADAADETGVDGSERDRPRADGSVLRAAGEALGLGILGPALAILLLEVAGIALRGVTLPLFVGLALTLVLGQYVAFGGVALGYLWNRFEGLGEIRSYLGLRLPSLREIGVVVGGYVVIYGMLVVLSAVIRATGAQPGQNQTAELAFARPEVIPFLILAMFLVVGPCEELLYRGVVQSRLREVFPAVVAIAVTSALFAAVHVMALTGDLTARLTTVAILFFPSLVFGAVYEYTENLVVAILLHAINNSIILAGLYVVAASGEELPSIAVSLLGAALSV